MGKTWASTSREVHLRDAWEVCTECLVSDCLAYTQERGRSVVHV